ncbi:LegC family aminotransferase [Cohnella hashimotonis]|uniref:LegC family aminotransferase n=1 Tax=Cohnella hashimotonis TaxID=2826895 RepID=A0ABT6TVK8_9BACL|nr:LegC family aminotransferase [Cohnella hashimotonis]MDI4650365.1 LegC family aminotransferase [Cohnella hashimotonis]
MRLTDLNTSSILEALKRSIEPLRGAGEDLLPLHAPEFDEQAWTYVKDCLDTGWVSSVGSYVTRFEQMLAQRTEHKHAVAVVNGTAGLQAALVALGIGMGDEVLIPSLTFVATANAVVHAGAVPHFVEAEWTTLGIDPLKLEAYLESACEQRSGTLYNKTTGRRVATLIPMHTFGHPSDMERLGELAHRLGLKLIEDAAEALGSFYRERHVGHHGQAAVLSFNGNKIITTGGGGAVLTDDDSLARRLRHLTTTAKLSHRWAFEHDEPAFNFRLPNLNAALGCAQLERLDELLDRKRRLAFYYKEHIQNINGIRFLEEPEGSRSNYWLNAIALEQPNMVARDQLLDALNDAGIQVRPIWTPMHLLKMFSDCPRMPMTIVEDIYASVINLPSSAALGGRV